MRKMEALLTCRIGKRFLMRYSCILRKWNSLIYTQKCLFVSWSTWKKEKKSLQGQSHCQKKTKRTSTMRNWKQPKLLFQTMWHRTLEIWRRNSDSRTNSRWENLRISGKRNTDRGNPATSIGLRRGMTGTSTIRLTTIMTTLHLKLCKGTSSISSIQILLIEPRVLDTFWSLRNQVNTLLFDFMQGLLMKISRSKLSIENGTNRGIEDSGALLRGGSCLYTSTSKLTGIESKPLISLS
mmetsp:Transcript_2804/g.4289  ORF Transcript_2804/g.4289 Transcript_2804/m.4289 type:complete len:238 (+) Transcript_2804:1064-1777(+)